MKIDGSKKFTAQLSALGVALVGVLVASGVIGEGSSNTLIGVIGIVIPIAGATLYEWIQSLHDKRKEEVKIEVEKTKQVTGYANEWTGDLTAGTVVPPSAPFDAEEFMEVVMGSVGSKYPEINPSTILYTAQAKILQWNFNTREALRDARELILTLAEKAFQDIWGVTFEEEKNKPIIPEECTLKNFKQRAIAKGTSYYTAYLQVTNARKDLVNI